TAEAAVERVQSDARARMLRSTDPYLRDRLHDLEDLGHRLMRQLVGQDHAPSREQLPENAILIARAMGPAALLDYDRKRLRGLVLEEGTANSHVSIVARALGIPAVGEVPNAPGIADPGDAIIVDGTSGEIYVRPSAEIESAYAERVRFRARRRAGGGRALRIMFPMISEVAEFDAAKAIVERELTYLRQHGHTLPERIDIGTMVEVPALLYQLDELLKKVDFVSVGSNDLFQFLFAVDRGNAKVSERFDTMSAPIMRALRDIARKAQAAKKSASLCGEMASKPIGALALIALGYRSLSLSATGHGPVKALILDLDAKKAEAMMAPLLDAPSGTVSIRERLTAFAEAEGPSL